MQKAKVIGIEYMFLVINDWSFSSKLIIEGKCIGNLITEVLI
jgi:hypothetical protein